MIQTNMVLKNTCTQLIQQTIHDTNWTNNQVFLENNIDYQNQSLSSEKLQALFLYLKAQKLQDNISFYCKEVQKMPLRTLPEAVLYLGQGHKGEILPRLHFKEQEVC